MSNNSTNNPQEVSKEKINHIMKLYSNGNYTDAISLIKLLNESYPNVPLLFNILGVCYKSLEKFEDSIQAFENAVTIKPDYAEAYNNLGITLIQFNELNDAVNNLSKAIAIMPNFTRAHYNLGIALKKLGRLDESINSYKKVIELNTFTCELINIWSHYIRIFINA